MYKSARIRLSVRFDGLNSRSPASGRSTSSKDRAFLMVKAEANWMQALKIHLSMKSEENPFLCIFRVKELMNCWPSLAISHFFCPRTASAWPFVISASSSDAQTSFSIRSALLAKRYCRTSNSMSCPCLPPAPPAPSPLRSGDGCLHSFRRFFLLGSKMLATSFAGVSWPKSLIRRPSGDADVVTFESKVSV